MDYLSLAKDGLSTVPLGDGLFAVGVSWVGMSAGCVRPVGDGLTLVPMRGGLSTVGAG